MPDSKRIQDEALLAIAKGDWAGAARLYAAVEELDPAVGTWPLRQGECLRQAGEIQAAMRALMRAAQRYGQQGKPGKATEVCHQILELDPHNTQVPAMLERLQSSTPPTPGLARATPVARATATSTPAARALAAAAAKSSFPIGAITAIAEDPLQAAEMGEAPDEDFALEATTRGKTSAQPRVVLPLTPFFSALSDHQVRQVNTRARLIHLSAGETIYAAGEAAETLLVLAAGQMAVLQPQEVARLERGDVFGEEVVVLPGQGRMATLRAAEPCQVLILDGDLIHELVTATPALVDVLSRRFCNRLVTILARTSPLLAPVPESDRLPLLARFRYAEVEQGSRICEPDDGNDGLFILLAGAATATFDDKAVERLQPGDVFGEIALITDSRVGVTVTAREKCFVLHLPTADFAALQKSWPGLPAYLKALADNRLARLEQAILDDAPVSQSVPLPPRILVVHEESEARQGYERVLSAAGFLVDATGAAKAVEELLASRRYDVVLYNLDPLGGAGSDLLRNIRRHDLDVPIILTTRHGAFDHTSATANYSVVRGFVEPFDVSDLVRAANRAVHFHRLTRLRREAMTRLSSSGEWMGDRTGLEFHFENAVAHLHMAFQPVVSAVDNCVFGYEALLRSGEEILHSPNAVLRAAERLNRMHDVGRKARDTIAGTMGGFPDPPIVFVHVHSHDLLDPHLVDPDASIAAFARRIVLEVTERTPLDELDDLAERTRALRAVGYRFALDNLGAGHAGVGSLAQLEPEVCKLDMSLVRDIDHDTVKLDLVRAMLAVCRDMNILTICKGVETLAERNALLALGADLMQGFLFAKPGPAFPPVDFAMLAKAG